jgi:putative ABC transport system substrate-binding protein
MKEHGYDVGRNLIVDSRYAEGDAARYPALVDEVIALKPDVLIGANTDVAIVMKSRTTSIPIVLGTTYDPVGAGLAQSLARPGGNVTGTSLQIDELSAKHIEMMAEVLPRMRRVALLIDVSAPQALAERYERLANTTAAARGLALQVHRVDSLEEIREAFRLLEVRRADALLVGPSPRFNALRREISQSAANIRLPSIGFVEEYAQDGGLMSYGASFVEALRRAAYYVDRILKGAKPSDLPIEQPTKFFLVINARTAKALGIRIPASILQPADRVIE